MKVMRTRLRLDITLSASDIIDLVCAKLGLDTADLDTTVGMPQSVVAQLSEHNNAASEVDDDAAFQIDDTDNPGHPDMTPLGVTLFFAEAAAARLSKLSV